MGLSPLSFAGTRVSWAARCCCDAVLSRGKHGKLRINTSRTKCYLFGDYGKHLLSFPLNLDTIGQVLLACVAFYSDFHLGGERDGV